MLFTISILLTFVNLGSYQTFQKGELEGHPQFGKICQNSSEEAISFASWMIRFAHARHIVVPRALAAKNLKYETCECIYFTLHIYSIHNIRTLSYWSFSCSLYRWSIYSWYSYVRFICDDPNLTVTYSRWTPLAPAVPAGGLAEVGGRCLAMTGIGMYHYLSFLLEWYLSLHILLYNVYVYTYMLKKTWQLYLLRHFWAVEIYLKP